MDDGVGVVLDGASEVVLVADLHRFVDGGPEPGHFRGSQTGNRRKRKWIREEQKERGDRVGVGFRGGNEVWLRRPLTMGDERDDDDESNRTPYDVVFVICCCCWISRRRLPFGFVLFRA
ncbi:hypothetical protein TIFTF001_026440 [Ficus carica]|uniref:Uncharacterized protein n=1 Tax=Ficus carica TaxID=3494 RepID=A0AA88DL89_FICCA|nr:hypothetical protein TIFTF001_026440 [Ficus carica]